MWYYTKSITAYSSRGFQFSWVGDLYHFTALIFADVRDHAHYTLYNRSYFAGLIFAVSRSSVKTAKIGPLQNFPLYGMQEMEMVVTHCVVNTIRRSLRKAIRPGRPAACHLVSSPDPTPGKRVW